MTNIADYDEHGAGPEWWQTAISRVRPNEIDLRGYPIEQLIGVVSFADVIWLLLRGDLPSPRQSALLEAALVASVDHGPQAPSIASARMAMTCGVGLNNAVASGVNALGDVHGGAGQQCMTLLGELHSLIRDQHSAEAVVDDYLAQVRRQRQHVPGFGHRFHTRDPRRDPLLALVSRAVADGVVEGRYLRIAELIEKALGAGARPIPMNIDGVTAVVYAELGFAPELGRGLFVLSRSVGIVAHAWEESTSGARIKGPLPRTMLPSYSGTPRRNLTDADAWMTESRLRTQPLTSGARPTTGDS